MRRSAALICGVWLMAIASAEAQQRYALIVSGASGGAEYAEQYAAWTSSFSETLTGRMKLDKGNITALFESEEPQTSATAANVRKAIAAVRARMGRNDLFVILLVGHGTSDGEEAKFNLVGPDLESSEWGALLEGLPGTVAVINTTAGSFPFIRRLSGPRRIVVAATDSAAQRFDTIFPEYFVRAFEGEGADLDKNGRVSLWEAFTFASAGVRRHYQQRGQLTTERPLLDDNGDGLGQSASDPGKDGRQATHTYLDESLPGAAPTDEALLLLLQRKALVEGELDELKIRRAFLQREEYRKEFERIVTELARVSSAIRQRGGS